MELSFCIEIGITSHQWELNKKKFTNFLKFYLTFPLDL